MENEKNAGSLHEKHRHLFKRYIAQASEYPPFTLDAARAEGVYLWDTAGKRYIDFISRSLIHV
ncbi:MAG: hypothetical protein K2L79_05275, partial [Bacteroidales bacterium]|nr:hypothetical protein [Bacteroidales bacterium]